jgi:hypothetical protein
VRHIREALGKAAAEEVRQRQEAMKREAELAAAAEEVANARRPSVAGFPEGGATAAAVSRALQRLVPDRARTFAVGRGRLRRTKTVRGWGFPLAVTRHESSGGKSHYRHRALVVSDGGRAFYLTEESQSLKWEPRDYFVGEDAPVSLELGASEVARIREAIIAWTGVAPANGRAMTPSRAAHLDALVAQGSISAAEAAQLAPNGAVDDAAWERIRNIAVKPSPPDAESLDEDAGVEFEWRAPATSRTPARASQLERLVAEGRMSVEEAERLAPDGTVSDANWTVIRDL